jgi:hypothetical protein
LQAQQTINVQDLIGGIEMKGSLWVITFIVFGFAIAMFSRGYRTTLDFFNVPTLEGLFGILFYLAIVVFLLGILALIMYGTERQAGNVKIKNHLFEKILGHAPDAVLPGSMTQQPANSSNPPETQRKPANLEAHSRKGAKQ